MMVSRKDRNQQLELSNVANSQKTVEMGILPKVSIRRNLKVTEGDSGLTDEKEHTAPKTRKRRRMITLDTILERENLNKAWKRVKANKGSPGIDGMPVEALHEYLMMHGSELVESIKAGRYQPQPVRRVMIPKEEKGKFRPLGIPTTVDRFIQQAIAQKLNDEYESIFSPHCHGFRPIRSCQTAKDEVLKYANEGKRWVVDLDLSKFFDTVNHSKLLQILSDRIEDGRVISLIHKILRAPIAEDGKCTPCDIGTPQGGPVSPVLANILLNELDQELQRRGHAFVRYADDMMILCGSCRAAERILKNLKPFIEGKLFLKLNEEKSKICYIADSRLKFLGFGFWIARDGRIKVRPHQKSKAKCKARLKEITKRSRGQSLDTFRENLARFVRGWVNYFRETSMQQFIKETDQWLRRRIRQLYWKQWKKTRTRYAGLVKLGIPKETAWMWANSRKSYWRVAASQVLHMSLTNDFLRQMGWICLSDVA